MSRRKKKTSKKSSFNLKYIVYFLLLVIFSLSAFIVGILITQKNYEKELKKTQNSIKILQEKIKKLKEESKHKIVIKIPQTTNTSSEIVDYKNSTNTTTTVVLPPKPKIHKKNKKPKLVIIIDDVSFRYQTKLIKQIPYKITPSFFPPTQRHPNTPVLAKSFKDYMVHVPMEAIHFKKPEPKTLNIDASYLQIKTRIENIKSWFPRAHFINNHTGSTFTSNLPAMKKLFQVLKEENLGFVDSMTTPHSKGETVEKIYHIPFFKRNIFLDNQENSTYIQNQLKKAVKLAKKYGYAIAIGHPHKVTLQTLKNAHNILKDVDVVYIDELANEKH